MSAEQDIIICFMGINKLIWTKKSQLHHIIVGMRTVNGLSPF
jgi:hypothetical protein